VRAIDTAGNVDPSPAARSFTVAAATTTTTTTTTTTPALTPPQTKIVKHPQKVVRTKSAMAKARFTFTSSRKGSRFSCKLDKSKWASCRSPKTYQVKLGKHIFQVRATDSAGNTDPTPAKWSWTVKRVPGVARKRLAAALCSKYRVIRSDHVGGCRGLHTSCG
jgi:hypothetical protein